MERVRAPRLLRVVMAAVLARARIGAHARRQGGEPKSLVELALQEQATVGADRRATKRELHRAVELEPLRPDLGVTRRVRLQCAAPRSPNSCEYTIITACSLAEPGFNRGVRAQKSAASYPFAVTCLGRRRLSGTSFAVGALPAQWSAHCFIVFRRFANGSPRR